MRALIIAAGVLALSCVVNAALACSLRRLRAELEAERRSSERLAREIGKITASQRIKDRNEEERNERVDDLRAGRVSADDILPKRQ